MTSIDCKNYNIINAVIDIDNLGYGITSYKCDDFMAPIVSELNKRGYCTWSCCQGHYIEYDERCSDEYNHEYDTYTKLIKRDYKYTFPNIRFLPESYLRLANHVSSIPSEWKAVTVAQKDAPGYAPRNEFMIVLKDTNYNFNNPYEFYARMVELHRILYDWVCTLPTYPDNWNIVNLNIEARTPDGMDIYPNWKDSVLFLSDEEKDIHEKEVEAQLAAQLAEYRKNHPAG